MLNIYSHSIASSISGRPWYKEGLTLIDVTAKAGHPLAPPWELVIGLKKGQIDWGTYREDYLQLLRTLWKRDQQPFLDLLKDGVTLGCYCRNPKFCHRSILAEVLVKIAMAEGIPAVYAGELSLFDDLKDEITAIDKEVEGFGQTVLQSDIVDSLYNKIISKKSQLGRDEFVELMALLRQTRRNLLL
jgi:uncharacterized protein YeaO (DUF488 family)